jgi:glycosyltransferase involved in cell wall biosynthesis
MQISVVLAAHNESESIAEVIAQLREVVGEAELIVVDDGSVDETADLAERAGAQVIRCSPNRGKGAAMRCGIAASSGDWLIFLDADGQDDPADIPTLLAEISEGVGLINGSRFLGTLLPGSIHPLNRIANQGLTALLSLLFGHRITDSQAGFRVIRGDLARAMALRSDEYEFETEVLAKVLCSDLRVVEVPVTRHPRSGGSTDFRRVHNGLRILRTMLRERALHSPLGGI